MRHCLEKRPEERFDTAHDLAFALEGVLGVAITSDAQPKVGTGPAVRRRRWIAAALMIALAAAVPYMERGPWLLVALTLVGAGALGAHPQYYALAQDLPSRHMGVLSGSLAASSWLAVGTMQGAIGDHIKETGSYDLPLTLTGLAPLAGLLAMVLWATFGQSKR